MDFPKSSGIYMITNKENGKCYIGQSENVRRRVEAHERALRHNTHYNSHLQNAWNKYGNDAFEFTLLEVCPEEFLDEREIFYIESYSSFLNGYNMNIGGSSNRGYRHTDESKQKMRESRPDVSGKNNPMFGHAVQEFMTAEEITSWKHKLSKAMSGEKSPFYGKTHSLEARKKISAAHKGKFVGENNPCYGRRLSGKEKERLLTVQRLYREQNPDYRYINAKKVFCLSTKELFNSIADAARYYGVGRRNITSCCSGRTHYAGADVNGVRLVWAYYDDYLNLSSEEINQKIYIANHAREGKNSGRSKAVICLTTGEIFESANIAAKHYNIDNSSLCKTCKGDYKYCGKHPDGTPLRWAFYKTEDDNSSNCA